MDAERFVRRLRQVQTHLRPLFQPHRLPVLRSRLPQANCWLASEGSLLSDDRVERNQTPRGWSMCEWRANDARL